MNNMQSVTVFSQNRIKTIVQYLKTMDSYNLTGKPNEFIRKGEFRLQ